MERINHAAECTHPATDTARRKCRAERLAAATAPAQPVAESQPTPAPVNPPAARPSTAAGRIVSATLAPLSSRTLTRASVAMLTTWAPATPAPTLTRTVPLRVPVGASRAQRRGKGGYGPARVAQLV